MEGEPFYKPINLLILAENDTLQNDFIGDLKDFLQNKNDKPVYVNNPNFTSLRRLPELCFGQHSSSKYMGNTTFRALYHEFNIINGPGILESDTSKEILSNFIKIQDHFTQPLNLNAIIFLMRPDPKCYEHFLSLNLFNNFSKDDIAKIEKNVMFVFVHNNLEESYQKRDMVNVDLWSVLDRIGVDLLHSLTLHCHSPLDKNFSNTFLQFLNKNKRTVPIETVYSHESVLKTVGNEDVLDLLLDALYVNEINIENDVADETKQYYLSQCNHNNIVCTNRKCLKTCYSKCSPRESLKNISTCTLCNCSVKDHKLAKYIINEKELNSQYGGKQKEYRHTLITTIVAIDLFHKEYNASVGQLYHRIMERIKQNDLRGVAGVATISTYDRVLQCVIQYYLISRDSTYSILETLYKNEMDSHKKGITANDCMKCIRNSFVSLEDFIKIEDSFKYNTLLAKGSLRVKN